MPGIHKCTEKEYPFVLWEWWVHVCLVNQSITYYYIYRLSPGNITLLYAPMLSQKKQSWYREDMHNYITISKYHFAIIYLLISIGWNKDADALLLYIKSRQLLARIARQAESWQFDLLKLRYGKKMEESCSLSSLKRPTVLNLINEQSTILKVARQQIFIMLREFRPTSQQPWQPH